MLGQLSLAVPGAKLFYLGLAFIILGTGLLKPNVSAIVGELYGKEDQRRDAGFSIFYMGINLGAFIAPLIVGGWRRAPGSRVCWRVSASIPRHRGTGASASVPSGCSSA